MFSSAELFTTLLLALPTVQGSVIAERQAAVPIKLQFSVPGSIFPTLKYGPALNNYLQPQSTRTNNMNTNQLTQGFNIIDMFLSQGPAAAARLGATFLGDPGKLKVQSTNATNNNPQNVPIFSTCQANGAPGDDASSPPFPGGPGTGGGSGTVDDDFSLSSASFASGTAACAASALYGNQSVAAASQQSTDPDSSSSAGAAATGDGAADANGEDLNAKNGGAAYAQILLPGAGASARAAGPAVLPQPARPAQRPAVGAVGLVEGKQDGPHTVIGQQYEDLLIVADCLAGATGATAKSTFSTTLVLPINNPSVNKTYVHEGLSTCAAGVSARDGGVQFYKGRSSSWVQAAPDYCPSGGVKAVVSCNGKTAFPSLPVVVYNIGINGTLTSSQGFVGTLTVKKTTSVAASCR